MQKSSKCLFTPIFIIYRELHFSLKMGINNAFKVSKGQTFIAWDFVNSRRNIIFGI